MRRCLVMSGLVFLFTIIMLSYASATDLTADMITKEGKITSKGKVYVNGSKIRADKGNTPIYTIVRGDKGVFWQINGAENTYVEGKITPARQSLDHRKDTGRDEQERDRLREDRRLFCQKI